MPFPPEDLPKLGIKPTSLALQVDSLPSEPPGKYIYIHIHGAAPLVLGRHSPAFKLGFPGDSDDKESACSARDLGSIPGSGRSLEKEMATHSSILAWRIPVDRGDWRATVHGVPKSQT